MKRYGEIIKLKPEYLEEYKRYHANPWPGTDEMLKQCNIQNYSIFYRDGLLFAYYEYIGDDFEADLRRRKADPLTQKWWELLDPMQQPFEDREAGEWWSKMEVVYHLD